MYLQSIGAMEIAFTLFLLGGSVILVAIDDYLAFRKQRKAMEKRFKSKH